MIYGHKFRSHYLLIKMLRFKTGSKLYPGLQLQNNPFHRTLSQDIFLCVQKFNRVWLDIVADPTESVYGGGEQYTFLNLRQPSINLSVAKMILLRSLFLGTTSGFGFFFI